MVQLLLNHFETPESVAAYMVWATPSKRSVMLLVEISNPKENSASEAFSISLSLPLEERSVCDTLADLASAYLCFPLLRTCD
jgi:hypothetical protein